MNEKLRHIFVEIVVFAKLPDLLTLWYLQNSLEQNFERKKTRMIFKMFPPFRQAYHLCGSPAKVLGWDQVVIFP